MSSQVSSTQAVAAAGCSVVSDYEAPVNVRYSKTAALVTSTDEGGMVNLTIPTPANMPNGSSLISITVAMSIANNASVDRLSVYFDGNQVFYRNVQRQKTFTETINPINYPPGAGISANLRMKFPDSQSEVRIVSVGLTFQTQ